MTPPLFPTFTRIIRRLRGKCVVCGNEADYYWYCSFTCGGMDGTFSVRSSYNLPKPSVFHGKCTCKKVKREEKYL